MSGEDHAAKKALFQPCDLVSLFQEEEERALNGGQDLYGLVCRRATPQECEEHDLLTGRRSDWIFYRVIQNDEIHFVAEQFMTLVQRNDGSQVPMPSQSGTFQKAVGNR